MTNENNFQKPQSFFRISDASRVQPILEQRLPKSCFIYNAAKMSSRFPGKTEIFVLGEDINESSWIVVIHFTEDYGKTIMISADQEKSKISKSNIFNIFSDSDIIEWKEPYWFVALEKWIFDIINEISLTVKGNVITVYPDISFYMDPQDCLQLDTRIADPAIKLQKLDSNLGLDFILRTWKYAKNGTRAVVERIIENNESGGVYLDGKPVCGVTTFGYGFLGMLYTDEDHRQKGYAKLCMQFAFKELAKHGMVPAASVERSNQASINFHRKLGCKIAGHEYWILYSG